MSHKHRVLLRKFVQEQHENQLSWPLVDSEYAQSDNIFTNASIDYKTMDLGPSFSDKEIVKRSIVGKPEQFYKVANIAGQQLRFLQPMPNIMQNVAKKLKKTSINEGSSASNSQRNARKVSDYGDKKIEQGANFEIKDKYDLLKSMKQINSIMQQNEQSRLEQIDKLNISEKIVETHDQRVFEKFNLQLQGWQQINRKLNNKVKRNCKRNDKQSLIDSQELYRNRVESLKLFDSLQIEESKCPAITWHNRLRSQYSPQKYIQQEEKQKIQLKNLLLEKIPRKEILGIYNPIKLVNEIDSLSNYSKTRSKSDYNQLKLNGTSVYQQELKLLKNDKSSFSQPYYYYKNKEVNTEEIIF